MEKITLKSPTFPISLWLTLICVKCFALLRLPLFEAFRWVGTPVVDKQGQQHKIMEQVMPWWGGVLGGEFTRAVLLVTTAP